MTDGCGRTVVFLLLMFGMAATLVALMTDYWYDVETERGLTTPLQYKSNNYRFGLWRRCYDDRPDPGTNCMWIYKELIPEDEDILTTKQMIRIHLMRSVVGLSIASTACCLFSLLSMVCALAPGNCHKPQNSKIYTASMLLVILAFISSMAGGVCFMAARDVEKKDLDMYQDATTNFLWSFMLHWIGTGLMFLAGCTLLYLVGRSYKDVTNKSHYYHPY